MDNNKLDKNEALARMSAAIRAREEGVNPDVLRRVRALMGGDTTGMDITPPKPDPEAAANRAVEAAASGQAQAQMPPRDPSSVVREGELAADPQEAERRQIRMQMLQEAAKSGQLPSYLK